MRSLVHIEKDMLSLAQAARAHSVLLPLALPVKISYLVMAKKAMKAMKSMKAKKGVKAMPKSGIADAMATACETKRSDMAKVLDALAELVTKEVKSTGKFKIPGVCMIKTRHKPATKAGKRMAFGKEMKVKFGVLCRDLLCHAFV